MAQTTAGQPPERIDAVEQNYLHDLLRQQQDAQAALNSHVQFLFRKYDLTPGLDSINQDGSVVRGVVTETEPTSE